MSKEEIKKQLETIVFEALGTASMCWSETPKGIFDSSQASDVGNEAVSNIMKLYDQFKQDEQSERIKELEGNIKYITETYVDLMSELNDKIKQLEANKQIDAVEFADFLMSDYEMDAFEKGHGSGLDGYLCWKLAGTNQKYTTQELFTLFKDEQLKKK